MKKDKFRQLYCPHHRLYFCNLIWCPKCVKEGWCPDPKQYEIEQDDEETRI